MDSNQELEFLKSASEDKVCHYLASRVRRIRREAKESQEAFAGRAGIPLRTYKRFEAHGRAHLDTFVRVLRVLNLTHYLLLLFPQAELPRKPTLVEKLQEISERRGSP